MFINTILTHSRSSTPSISSCSSFRFTSILLLTARWICSKKHLHSHYLTTGFYYTYLLHGLTPQANYTDRATAACRRS
jgi:hypothetical protein